MTDRDDVAGYEALADLLRGMIATGALRPGDRLPSELELTQRHGLARDTVRRAVTLLRQEGVVEVRRGYGAFVFDRGELIDIALSAGAVLEARPPSPAERRQYGVPDGWPLLVVIHPDGRHEAYSAHRYRVVVGSG